MAAPFRYRQLGYVVLGVTDLDETTAFATDVFGMDAGGEHPGGGRFLRASTNHHDILVERHDQPAFVRSSWQLESEDDVDAAFAHFRDAGRAPAWVPADEAAALKLERAFRVTDPVIGATWEYFAHMSYVISPRKNKMTRFQGGKHFGFTVPNCKAIADYMSSDMGFIPSDYLEGWLIALLRAFPNPNHHSFAPVQSRADHAAFHHVAFMVEEIDDIGKLFNRIKRFDVGVQFGIGRHPTSGSIHLYIYGPDYFVWEYTLGMEQFPEHGAREARRMSAAPENFDLWGAMPDAAHNHEMPRVLTAQ